MDGAKDPGKDNDVEPLVFAKFLENGTYFCKHVR
jgi:hypothetical protein